MSAAYEASSGASQQAGTEGVEVRLLGPVRAWRDGTELALGSARRTAVFCVLALHAGQAVGREELVAAVWGEEAPASATGNVYTYVSALRQALEPDRDRWAAGQLLTTARGTYTLHVPADSVDVVRFEQARRAAQRHRAAGNAAAELAAVEAALRQWTDGEALAGVPGPYAEAQRLRLAELRLAGIERYAALLADAGRHHDRVRVLRTAIEQYPEREHLRALLDGGPDTPTAEPVQVPARIAPVRRATLVGRDTEIRWLRRACADAVRGHGHSLRVQSPPGGGRSALLTAALRGPVPDGCRIGWATGDELSARVPAGLLLDCLESAGVPATAGDPDALVEAICRAAADAPLILVIDDLHWADPLTLTVWSALAERAPDLPLLLVAAARADLPPQPADEVIELPALAPAAATALLRELARSAPGGPPEPDALARILDDTGGNPYYLRHRVLDPAGVPAAVAAHLAGFGEPTRQVLRVIAFLGAYDLARPGAQVGCDPAGLAAVHEGTSDELARALDPALAAGILTTDDADRLVFRYRIAARALHEGTPTALRVTLHRSFALRIAASGGVPEQVAAQLLAGDVPLDDAVSRWLVTNVEALAERAPDIAVPTLRRAWSQHALDPAQRLLLTAWLARLLLRADQNAAVEASWVAARSTDPELEGEMRWIAATSHERRGDYQTASDVAWGALRERRVTARWMVRLRAVVTRARPHLAGDPTEPYSRTSATADTGRRLLPAKAADTP